MAIDAIPPVEAIDTAPLSSIWQTPRDSFRELAERSRRNPEAVELANAVGAALAEYLEGAITLREFARRHTPYERFRAVRVWGPDDERFIAIMPVLDELIALHREGKTEQVPANVRFHPGTFPVVAVTGEYECANGCGRHQYMVEGNPQLCRTCKAGLGLFRTER
jgi:hypothetical protein